MVCLSTCEQTESTAGGAASCSGVRLSNNRLESRPQLPRHEGASQCSCRWCSSRCDKPVRVERTEWAALGGRCAALRGATRRSATSATTWRCRALLSNEAPIPQNSDDNPSPSASLTVDPARHGADGCGARRSELEKYE